MEFNARYTIISAFAIAVLVAAFGFLYWLNNSGGFGPRVDYQIRFSVPVSGLSNGSNVLFNGLKVGEVVALQLDPQNPGEFTARISVSDITPMRQDTKAGIEYQGLTGAANVSLTGGAADSPLLTTADGRLPQLIAKPADTRSWTTSAARVLNRLDEMLSGETNRFDAILAGLERMVGGDAEKEAGLYDLAPATGVEIESQNIAWQLVISEPTVVLALNTDKFLEMSTAGSWKPFGSAKWTDNLPNLFQAKLIQSFENAGLGEHILRPADAFDPEFKLGLDIRTFHYQSFGQPAVVLDIVAKIMGSDANVIGTKRFQSRQAIQSQAEADIAAKMSELFSITAAEIIVWSTDVL